MMKKESFYLGYEHAEIRYMVKNKSCIPLT